ncbi:putative copper-transporting ATPase 1 [Rosellinia necatrix]|uniref:Putative copper-transporting ATPase 1 n=1 Tax=Rosellinia necatrix TaxID=77044 RepID=A0A1W2TW78_ROSNE|nr:putative copper-transporting ATPase 1 [Rosellinia necatrix]
MAPLIPSHPSVTIFLVANIHCPTCVSSIKDALQGLDGVRWVSPNIITSCVAVYHDPAVLIMEMVSKLEAAGFEVSSISSANGVDSRDNITHSDGQSLDHFGGVEDCLAKLRRLTHPQGATVAEERLRAHLNNCEQCQEDATNGSFPKTGVTLDTVRRRSDPGTSQKHSAHTTITSTHSPSTVDDSACTPRSWRASLAISGMTCAACANAITRELGEKDWILKVAVNLVSNSAVVDFLGDKNDVTQVVENIEDLGYDAHIDRVDAIEDEKEKDAARQRTVQIRIDGFYCRHCGDHAASGITGFEHDIRIDRRPTWENPILEVTYVPQAPGFTIRRILAAIEASDPAFKASVYHPPTLEERAKELQARHQKQILLRVLLALIIAIPTFIIGIVYMSLVPNSNQGKEYLMKPWVSGINRAQIALFILATPVYFCAADVFHRRTVREIWSLWRPGSRTPVIRRLYRFGSMNMLISLGTTIAYVSSVSQMISAGAKSLHMIDDKDFYFDSVVFLTLFLLVGRFLEAYSKSKTGNAVEALGKLRPTTAILVEETESGKTSDRVVGTDMLEFGDTVRVTHGASPPCDGEVLQGNTVFDEAGLTGESHPIRKNVGDPVFSGTVNQGSPILIRVMGTAGQSMLDQIVKVVREGQTKRAPMEKVADALVAYFVPVITFIAVITWIVWLAIGLTNDELGIKDPVPFSLQFAIAVFVVACPCGLALAAPTAIFVGGGLAAKYGILVKGGGEAFETASRIDCVVFDKTGTLTVGGEPTVTDAEVYLEEGTNKNGHTRLFAALRTVEENSSHPIAKAIVTYCKTTTSESIAVNDVEEIPGKGLKATCTGDTPDENFDILVGNEALMKDFSVRISPLAAESLEAWKMEAKSVALIAIKSNSAADMEPVYVLSASLSISDPIRPETPMVINSLRQRGCDVWMLSGDNAVTARAVALRIGIPQDNVIAEVLPTQKFEKIKYLQSVLKVRVGKTEEDTSRRATVAMVGDGINDAPALSMADAGIAIGSGSDVAISSADFVLVNSNLMSVITLLDLSRKVFRRIKLNFAWALVYNLIAIPIAAGCLYAVQVGGRHVTLDPVWASLAMALSSFSVVMSSLALKTRIPGIGFRARNIDVGQTEAWP